jgi:hypothetical protein
VNKEVIQILFSKKPAQNRDLPTGTIESSTILNKVYRHTAYCEYETFKIKILPVIGWMHCFHCDPQAIAPQTFIISQW